MNFYDSWINSIYSVKKDTISPFVVAAVVVAVIGRVGLC